MKHFSRWSVFVSCLVILCAGCLTKEPTGPIPPPDDFFLTLSFEIEDIEPPDPRLFGNFSGGWYEFPMVYTTSNTYAADSLQVGVDRDYICNIIFNPKDGNDRWAASTDGIEGELRARTTEMQEFVVISELVPNNFGSFNFLIRIDEDGVIHP